MQRYRGRLDGARGYQRLPQLLDILGQVQRKPFSIRDVGKADMHGSSGGPEPVDVPFIRANASALTAIGFRSFDVVVASMSLMGVEAYLGAIRQVDDVLRTEGELAMSIPHPYFSAPVSKWIRDDVRQLELFAFDRYFEQVV